MKKRKLLVFLMIGLILTANSVIGGGKSSMTLEVVDSSGTWDTLTPMYLKTSDSEDVYYAEVNATNINATEPLEYLQYIHWIFDYINYSDPAEFSTDEFDFLLEMEFGDATYCNVSYNWEIEDDGLETTYAGYLDVYINDTHLVDKADYGVSETHKIEFHLWRSKSNQIVVQWLFGEAGDSDRAVGAIIGNWGIENFTYTFQTISGREAYFEVMWKELSYQCGSNEGISDPVTNENWGIFEPIRQILLFILDLFIGLIDLILPEKIEKVFHHYLDRLDDYIDPFLDVILWLGSNWLEILLLIHVFLIIRGVERASKGDLLGLILPLWEFYGKIFNITMRIVGFIVNIIKAMLEAIPF